MLTLLSWGTPFLLYIWSSSAKIPRGQSMELLDVPAGCISLLPASPSQRPSALCRYYNVIHRGRPTHGLPSSARVHILAPAWSVGFLGELKPKVLCSSRYWPHHATMSSIIFAVAYRWPRYLGSSATASNACLQLPSTPAYSYPVP